MGSLAKKILCGMLCAIVVSMAACGSDSENFSDDKASDSVKQAKSAGFDKEFKRLVISNYELGKDDYLIKRKGGTDYLLVRSEVFKSSFRIPYLPNNFPELDWNENEIRIMWGDNDKFALEVLLQEGSSKAVVNGEKMDIGISPLLKGNELYIPANMFITLLEMETTYDSQLDTLFVERKEDFPKELLLGKWCDTDTNLFMGVKDLATGAVDLPSYTEGYTFNKDGTFTLVIVNVGGMNDVLLQNTGKYKIIGNNIVCYDILETLYEGNPFELSHKNKPLDNPSYEYIGNYNADENKIELTFWLSRME